MKKVMKEMMNKNREDKIKKFWKKKWIIKRY
jgi:hypothetical protein